MTLGAQHDTASRGCTTTAQGQRLTRARSIASRVLLLVLPVLAAGCARAPGAFPLREPLAVDPDRRPFESPPAEYESALFWDGADQMVFRPFARLWAVDPGGEAVNVNALDEVPDSSWWTNRIGVRPVSAAEAREGPCKGVPPLDEETGPWEVFKAKPNGATPGFFVSAPDGRKYVFKVDGLEQAPRPTAADAIASRLYHLVGYNAPCNRVVFARRSLFTMKKGAKSEDPWGAKVPMGEREIDDVLAKAARTRDGRFRGSMSLLLDGEILGPFRYEGTRDDDPNDVVPHEDRRELRASQVIGGWLNHTDAREQNTLDTWIPSAGGGGYVRHYLLDFSDCMGTVWDPPLLGRRLGHTSYFDAHDVMIDFLGLGLVERPWEDKRFGPSKAVFGYYDIEHYDPESWQPGYDNPAMLRKTERDAAWMTRIIARIDRTHLTAILEEARIENDFLEKEAMRLLEGRRQKLLLRFLTRLSPLTHPTLRTAGRGVELCLEDAALVAGVADPRTRRYTASAEIGAGKHEILAARTRHGLCLSLPFVSGASRQSPEYVIVAVKARGATRPEPAVRVHLYALGPAEYRVVGLTRPMDGDSP
jgi:hypothetical protein